MNLEDLKSLDELQFAQVFQRLRQRFLEDPIKHFIEASNILDFTPTPAQTVALKCIFNKPLDPVTKHEIYKEDLTDDEEFDLIYELMTEVELYELMTGFEYVEGSPPKGAINLIVGRRGGKSTIAAIIAIFSMFKLDWRPYLKKTPVATVLVLSHSVDFSKEILNIIRNLVETSPILNMLRDSGEKDTQREFHVKTPFIDYDEFGQPTVGYSKVKVSVGAASKKTTRGHACCTVLCDEIGFWNLDENSAESDTDVMRAVRPTMAQFGSEGTLIKLSSPWIKQGELYEEWTRKEELKQDYYQFKAPSWVWNTIIPVETFRKDWRKDSEGFDTEFRANFVDSISNFISPEFVDTSILKGVKFLPPAEDANTVYSAAIDAAFKSDKFAFSLVGYNEKRVTTYIVKYWEGTRKAPVQANEVAKYIRTICGQYGISEVATDQYSFQPLREIFQQYGISLVENVFSLPYKRKIYFSLKRLLHNQTIDLLDIPLLAKEIKELQVENTTTGQIKIGHPVGGSDDLADSLAIACQRALEKAGQGNIVGEVAVGSNSLVQTDLQGKAFTAPAVEMLSDYNGFGGASDNSKEYAKDPETGKMRRKSEMEEEEALPGSSGGNFIF